MKSIRTKITTAIVAMAIASPGSAANLIINGDFESGNIGFSSDYAFSPANGSPPAVYTVASDPSSWNRNFVSAGDHTTGSGLMMIVNGSQNAGDIVWRSESLSLSAATDYFFEAFVMNVFPDNPPVLTFAVSLDGGPEMVLDTLDVPNATGFWNGLSTSFNSGGASTASLFLRNAQTAFGGNDFAIDDISLDTKSVVNPPNAVPEPTTWLMLIFGFGMIGSAMRRTRTTVGRPSN